MNWCMICHKDGSTSYGLSLRDSLLSDISKALCLTNGSDFRLQQKNNLRDSEVIFSTCSPYHCYFRSSYLNIFGVICFFEEGIAKFHNIQTDIAKNTMPVCYYSELTLSIV